MKTAGGGRERAAFLGLDCGTQSTKAALLDADSGDVIALGRAGHPIIERPDGTREQHPDWWIDAAASATRQAMAEAGRVSVRGIGVSGQQHGLVALGHDDRPLRPAKLWNDTTTARECEELTEQLGGPDAVLALTGNLFLPGYTAPKVAWLRRHEPETYARSTRFCLPHDHLDLWLTGEFWTEPGDASGTAYFDVRARRYSEPVLAALDPGRDWTHSLPTVVDRLAPVGRLRPAAAEALGLDASVPVAPGGGDNMCAAIGVGAVVAGPVVVSLGTSGTAFSYGRSPAVDPRGEAAAFCDSTGGWLPLVCTLNCTVATEWVRRLFGLDHAAFEAAISRAAPGANGLAFLPHLDGERTPNVPGGAGAFAGLRATHTPDDLVRAVVEGVTFGLRYALDALCRAGVEPREITLVGGGAASDGWAQLVADSFGLPVHRPAIAEAAAAGAARQAMWAVTGSAPAPVEPEVSGRWEPRAIAALSDAAARVAELRRISLEGRL